MPSAATNITLLLSLFTLLMEYADPSLKSKACVLKSCMTLDGNCPDRYQLLLHGAAEIESPCFSLTTVPDPESKDASSGAQANVHLVNEVYNETHSYESYYALSCRDLNVRNDE